MKWFNNIKIRDKLFITFGALACILISFAVFAVTQIINMGNNINELTNTYQARQIHIADATTDLYRMRLANLSRLYLLEGGDFGFVNMVSQMQKNYEMDAESFIKNLHSFRNIMTADPRFAESERQERLAADGIEDALSEYMAIAEKIDASVQSMNKQEVFRLVEELIPVGNKLTGKVQDLRDLLFYTTKRKAVETTNSTTHIVNVIFVITIGFISLTALALLFTVNNITRPISQLEAAVAEIANGNLAYPIRSERKDELGILSNCIGDMVDDITEHNKIMATIEKEREEEERTQIMLDATPLSCMLWNKDLHLLSCNQETLHLFKLSNRQDFLLRFDELSPEHQPCGESSQKMARGYVRKAFEEGSQRFEWLHQTLDGETFPTELTLVRVKHREEDIVAAYARDLREHKAMLSAMHKAENELRLARDAAEAANHAKSAFLARMSHEIRTPMNAILGITQIFMRYETLTPNIKDAFNDIYNAGDLLLKIINDILDLSKIEAGKLELAPSKYEIASLISDIVTLNTIRIGSRQIEFELFVDANAPSTLFGDELRIKQVLNNLLSNAFKYTEEGTVRFSVSVETGSEEKESDVTLVCSVSDTGQGMTQEQVGKLFDEYARFNMEANRTTEGTGLGMSIARHLTQLMNGVISVKSELHKGSVFTVRLPQRSAGSDVLGEKLAENLRNFSIHGMQQIKIAQIVYEPMPYGSVLVVDDVESNLFVAKGLLALYALSVDTAISGFEAIDKITNGKAYDIVFMDHMMPNMDGMETTKTMRDLGYTAPIVALTANAVAGQADIFLANGFDDFLSKPIDVRQLNAVLKKHIRDKQAPEVIEAARRQKGDSGEHAADGTAQSAVRPQLAEFFLRDAYKALAALETVYEKRNIYEDEDIRLYTINAHAIRSALANVGEAELSAFAAKLEQAGREKDHAAIASKTPVFLSKLRTAIEKFTPLKEEVDNATADADYAYLRARLLAVKEACAVYDKKTAKDAITELRQKAWPRPTKELLGTMAEHLLNGDFEELAYIAEKTIETV